MSGPIKHAAAMTDSRSSTEETIWWLGQAYSAAETGQGWQNVIDDLARILGCHRLELHEDNGQSGPPLLESSSRAKPSSLAGFPGRSLRLDIHGHPQLALICYRDTPPSPEREGDQILADHLGRAWRLGSRPSCGMAGPCTNTDAQGCAVLDHLAMGVILVGQACGIVVANQQAQDLLAAGEGLSSKNGHLSFAGSAGHAELRNLVHAVIEGRSQGGAVSVSRSSEADLQILVVPSASQAFGSGTGDALCALFVTDPVAMPETPLSVLRGLYDLTKAEARVANLLLQGRRLEEASAQLGVTKETVRSQVKSIFDKVGTTRQTDLVRILLTGPGQLRWQTRKRTPKFHPFG
jgi:DNA-binding CsgD family transcriptional regulator